MATVDALGMCLYVSFITRQDCVLSFVGSIYISAWALKLSVQQK